MKMNLCEKVFLVCFLSGIFFALCAIGTTGIVSGTCFLLFVTLLISSIVSVIVMRGNYDE